MTTTPGPPAVNELDQHHAANIAAVRRWVDNVYPLVIRQYPDRTRAWWATAEELAQFATSGTKDPAEAIALLAEIAAETLLLHSENIHGRNTNPDDRS